MNPDRVLQLFFRINDGFAISHAGISKSLRYIFRNYGRPIQAQDLAVIAGLSSRGFFQAFRKHTGFCPAQLLRHLRMERAKRLLIESDLPLRQIAAQCGYRSINSFWVAFRQTTGLTPKPFRQQAQLDAAAFEKQPAFRFHSVSHVGEAKTERLRLVRP